MINFNKVYFWALLLVPFVASAGLYDIDFAGYKYKVDVQEHKQALICDNGKPCSYEPKAHSIFKISNLGLYEVGDDVFNVVDDIGNVDYEDDLLRTDTEAFYVEDYDLGEKLLNQVYKKNPILKFGFNPVERLNISDIKVYLSGERAIAANVRKSQKVKQMGKFLEDALKRKSVTVATTAHKIYIGFPLYNNPVPSMYIAPTRKGAVYLADRQKYENPYITTQIGNRLWIKGKTKEAVPVKDKLICYTFSGCGYTDAESVVEVLPAWITIDSTSLKIESFDLYL